MENTVFNKNERRWLNEHWENYFSWCRLDGVLNCSTSKSHCQNYTGIDSDKVKRLAKIVQATNARIVLISSWKIGWEPPNLGWKINYHKQFYPHAKYLNNHLKKKGNLIIFDKTRERNSEQRGLGIADWLFNHPEVKTWIVLDDEIFPDYNKYNIYPHLIKTDEHFGLTDENVNTAIKMLNS